MAMKYKKKPVVVEAVKWTGENHAEMCEFIDPEVFEIIPRVGLVIHTLEGDHHASYGDYIIKGVNGKFYPCKPDIFAKTYEAALPTLTPPNEWVSVKERRPQAGHDVISLLPCGDCAVVWWTGSVWRVRWDATQLDREPTHWMPLPAPPDRRPPEGEADA